MSEIKRCEWVNSDKIYQDYHDLEWGIPIHDDKKLFEMLILEGMQAGLSWLTVLKKRAAFRKAFDNFEIDEIIKYDDKKIESLLNNKDIIRNRLKINSVIRNAKAFKSVQSKYGSFDSFIWSYVDNMPIINHWPILKEVPANTPLSDHISKDLKKMGFNFVGSTIVYAFMQSVGMVNDHTIDCYLYKGK
ncbi:MAG: DNA-3-methyladenine glycosylase I [Firmicutes bacterium]|nr:DNA-3-methyladenine glycosylase I [Bacillota bacterium]